MQQLKSIQNISDIEQYASCESTLIYTFSRLLKQMNLSGINRILNSSKSKGFSGSRIFSILFMLPYYNIKNIWSFMANGVSTELLEGKDVYYRFLSNPNVSWRKLHSSFVFQYNKLISKHSIDEDDNSTPPKCIILDDTIFPKRGKVIEFIGKVFNHSTHAYEIGMKALFAGIWDGKSFIPVDFSIHNEGGKNGKRGLDNKEIKNQYIRERNSEESSFERVFEIPLSKIEVACDMIRRIIKSGFKAKYVLGDSWFICDELFKCVDEIATKSKQKLYIIGMMKSNRIIDSENKKYKLNNIPKTKVSNTIHCKKLKCSYISITGEYKATKAKFFLIRMNGQNEWKCIVSTDLNLSFIKVMEVYSIRWSIEVFFKDAKQYLGIGTNQSINFDSQIASITLSCMNYIALVLIRRFEGYESFGQLFKGIKDIILQDHIVTKIWNTILTILNSALSNLGIAWDNLIKSIINNSNILEEIANALCPFLSTKASQKCYTFTCET